MDMDGLKTIVPFFLVVSVALALLIWVSVSLLSKPVEWGEAVLGLLLLALLDSAIGVFGDHRK